MRFLGQALVIAGGALALWASTCFFAPPPRGNPTRQGERRELVPGARWEFDLGDWNRAAGVPMLSLDTDAAENAQVEARIERAGSEPRTKAFELHEERMIAAVEPGQIAVELTAYEGPPARGSVDVWNDEGDQLVVWGLRRSGGMLGLLAAALLVGLGLLLIWRRPKPAGEGASP